MTANFNHSAPRERGSTPERAAGAFGSSAGAVGRAVGPGRRGGGTELEAPLWPPPGTCWGWGSPTRGPPWALLWVLSVAPVWGYGWWHKGSGAVAVPQPMGAGPWLCPASFSVAVCLGSGLAPAWLPTRGGTRAALPRLMPCAGGAGREASWAGAPAAPSSARLLPVSAQQPVPCPAGDLPPADEHHRQVMSEGQAAKRRLGSLGEP